MKKDLYREWKSRWYPFPLADHLVSPFLFNQRESTQSWIKLARQALLLSTNELATRMKISRAAVSKMEKSEIKETITIETLKRAANALDCELVYVFKPKSNKLFSQIIWEALNSSVTTQQQTKSSIWRMKNMKIRRKNKWTIRKNYHDIRNRIIRTGSAQ